MIIKTGTKRVLIKTVIIDRAKVGIFLDSSLEVAGPPSCLNIDLTVNIVHGPQSKVENIIGFVLTPFGTFELLFAKQKAYLKIYSIKSDEIIQTKGPFCL